MGSKLRKQALLAAYFGSLTDEDLRLASRYVSGRSFIATDERVLGVSGAILSDVLINLLHLDPAVYRASVIRHGEIGDALRELWRVPSSPSASPLILTDTANAFDHIASTGTFDGKRSHLLKLMAGASTAREAAYITKIILGDLRTGVQDGVLLASIAQAFGRPIADIQRAFLYLGDVGDLAVLARNDHLDQARFKLFHPIQFMLATPQETASDAALAVVNRTFVAEDKLDGIRAQVHKSPGRLAIYTRTMDRTDASFPDVVQQLEQLPGEFLLDGEIVAWRDGQVLPFQHIQRRLGRKNLTARMVKENPAVFIAFDILYRDGSVLMEAPWSVRRTSLDALLAGQPLVRTVTVPVTSEAEIASAFNAARERQNEGLMLKDVASVYSPGKRGQMWFKLKTHLPTFDCVVTAAEFGHGKRRGSLSDYTFAVWDGGEDDTPKLVNLGKAYSGVTDAEIAQLTELFQSISTSNDGRVFQVPPRVVLEIACDQIQRSTRHAGGYALRFPRIKRIRWDKRPADADRLSYVAQVYASSVNFARGAPDLKPARLPDPGLFDSFSS